MEGKTSAGHILIWNGGTSIILLQHNGLSELLIYWCLQTFSVNYISLKMITSLHFAQHLNAFGNGGLYIEVPNCSLPLKSTISKSNVNFAFCFFSFFLIFETKCKQSKEWCEHRWPQACKLQVLPFMKHDRSRFVLEVLLSNVWSHVFWCLH